MPAPFEIYATGALDLYLAVPNTADPVVNVAPPGAWIKVGVSGGQNYGEDGVHIRKETENNEVYTTGSYGVRKVFRTREVLKIGVQLMDATLEAWRDAMNQTVVTAAAGPPAIKSIPLLENVATPTFRACLLRMSLSPYFDGGGFQFWVPVVYQTGSIDSQFRKSDPAILELEFTAVADATNGFGKATAQTS